MAKRGGHDRRQGGFTLLEIMIVVTILAIIASIGVPQYRSALRIARIGKARHELVTISNAIGAYQANNGGQLPLTLYQVGFGGRRDPWGTPYCYLNYGDGTGDGLQWAIDAGIVDPSAVKGYSPASTTSSGGGGSAPAMKRGSFLPASFRLVGAPQEPVDQPTVVTGLRAAARTAATAITESLARPATATEVDDLTGAMVAQPQFSMFTQVPTQTTRRRDRFMYPLNDDYDLFSLGPNGCTAVSLGETVGQDDVIRANNGGFFGLASDY